MAQLGRQYEVDPNEKEKTRPDPVPAGDYLVVIDDSDIKPGKNDASSEVLHLRMKIIDGRYKNRTLREFLCITKPSKKDVEAQAQNKLNAICVAVGLTGRLQDTNELHMIPFFVKVGVTGSDEDQYGKQNTIFEHNPAGDDQIPEQSEEVEEENSPAESRSKTSKKPWTK